MGSGRIRYVAEVACGICGDEFLGVAPLHGSPPASKVLREMGWVQTRMAGWVCPICAAPPPGGDDAV